MRDWAALDVTAAIEHVRARWPALPLAAVGHSFGGQAIGLVPNNDAISRTLMVAAQAGYWRLFQPPENYRVLAMLNAGRLVTHAFRLYAGLDRDRRGSAQRRIPGVDQVGNEPPLLHR